MNPRNSWILAALAAGFLIFILCFDRPAPRTGPVENVLLRGFKADAVGSLQIQWAKQFPMRVERTNGGWQLTNPLVYPAQALTVERLLQALEKLASHTHISAREMQEQPKADEVYGFTVPLVTFTIRQGAETRQIKFGKLTAPGDEVYLQVVGGEGIDTVDKSLFNAVPRTADDLRDTTVIALGGMAFDQITVAAAPKLEPPRMELVRNKAAEPWRIAKPLQARADNARIEELLYNLQTLRALSFVTDDPGTDLDQYGLQPPQLQLTFAQGTNEVAVLQFGRSPAAATNDSSQIYARRAGQKTIMLVSGAAVEDWRKDSTFFRDHHLIGPRALDFDVIEVRGVGGDKFTLQRQTNAVWRLLEPPEYPLDERRVKEFMGNLARLEIVPIAGQFAVKENVVASELAADYGLAPPMRQYVLKRAAANAGAPGSATNTVLVELDFGKIKDDTIYARRPDESPVYAVRLEDFLRLPTAGLQLRERRIWQFTAEEVKAVILGQNGLTQRIEHRGPLDYVIPQGSQGLTDSAAMESGVADLGEMAAENWVECGSTNRAHYGFSEKSAQIGVELLTKGQRQTLLLEFGGWSPAGRRYGAVRLDGQDWIFEMPKRLYDSLVTSFGLGDPPAR